LQLCLPPLAIAMAAPDVRSLLFWMDQTAVTPLRLTLLAAVLVYFHGLLVHRHPYFGIGAASCLGAAALGDNPAAMASNAVSIGDKSISSIWRLVPRTLTQWGLVSVAASFVLLGLGLIVSLLRPARSEVDNGVN
jgi:hypothetical protein